MKTCNLYINLIAACLIFPFSAGATHNVAGEITYEFSGTSTILASIITYTKATSYQADRDSLAIHWGDGSADEIIYRSNGPVGPAGIPLGDSLINNIKKSIYTGRHTFVPSRPFYIISMTDPNRNDGISNINGGNSVGLPFYLEDTVWMQGQANNHSPVLLYPPVDYATVGDTFYHNPTAYDIEADSMTFDLVTPLQSEGNAVPGFYLPSQVPYVSGDTITINRQNGLVTWAVPQVTGMYNIAILIREYRYGVPMSTIIRDMLIIVQSGRSDRAAQMGIYADTTIAPGQALSLTYTATDTSVAMRDSLYATGGPLTLAAAPALFTSMPGHPATATLTWTPGPNQYKARQTYIMTISAQASEPLAEVVQRSYRITVADTNVHTDITEADNSPGAVKANPIPASDHIHISSKQVFSEISIYTIDGRKLWQYDDMPAPDMNIDIRFLPEGEYILRTKGATGEDQTPFVVCR